MAWLLFGGGIGAGASYVASEISDLYDKTSKSINDLIDETKQEYINQENEAKRQEKINNYKKSHEKSNKIAGEYGLKQRNRVKIINDSEEICDIIYVNHGRAKNPNDAILWAKQELSANVFNRKNTKIDQLTPSTNMEIIPTEINEYTIVLHTKNQFVVLNKIDYDSKNIMVENKFKLTQGSICYANKPLHKPN